VHPVLFHIGNLLIPSYGAIAAVGVLLALVLAQHTARVTGLAPNHVWNLCVMALFAALIGSRLLLVVINWRDLLRHPMWMLGLATIHHPLLAAAGLLCGAVAAFAYARWQHMPLRTLADALAAPLALFAAAEQLGALLAGAGFGSETSVRWAIVYTNPLAARWSGAPLGVPVHPVQAYVALALAGLAVLLLAALPMRKQAGDIAGAALMGGGAIVYATEFWRDWEGRGAVLGGAVDGPQIAAVAMVLASALLLLQRNSLSANMEPQHG
jgi:phosphatidylglycerol:prolipoprotein diacylglycerol transferase